MIDFYEEVLIELSSFYPKGHFNNLLPEKYFNILISNLFQWHRLVLEPGGIESGEAMVSTIAGGNAMDNLKKMIVDMVDSLAFLYEIDRVLNVDKWRKKWLK